MAAIHVISPSEFKQNQKKFFDLALSERVVIKRGKDLFELVSKPYIDESVSPSGDPFFNDPRTCKLSARLSSRLSGDRRRSLRPN